MQLIKIDAQLDSLSLATDAQAHRSKGLHLSNILDDIEQTLEPGLYDNHPFNLELCAAVGFVWERVLERELCAALIDSGKLFRPGEIDLDGISMTPDGYNVEGILDEYKMTWQSSNRDIEERRRYWWQIKAYCHALGVKEARLFVFYLMGDYRGSGPQIKAWHVFFKERELVENWQMIINHKKAMEARGVI